MFPPRTAVVAYQVYMCVYSMYCMCVCARVAATDWLVLAKRNVDRVAYLAAAPAAAVAVAAAIAAAAAAARIACDVLEAL